MLYSFIIAIVAFGMVISYIIYRKIATPIGLFSIAWLLVLFVHSLGFMGYYQLSDETIDSVAYMAVSFLLGSLLGHLSSVYRPIEESEELTLHIYERYANILTIFLAIGMLGFGLFIVLRPEDSGNMSNVVRLSRSGEGLFRPVRELIYSVSLPCLLTIVLASSTLHSRLIKLSTNYSTNLYAHAKKIQYRLMFLLILSCGCLVCYDILTLGRIYTVLIAAILLTSYLITTKTIKFSMRYSLTFIVLAATITYLLTKVTVLRDIATGSAIYLSLLDYFTGPLAYYNIAIKNFSQYEFGRMTFGAFETFFLRPYDYIPIIRDFIPDAPLALTERQGTYFIGPHSRYNAFGTFMLDGYYDAGIIGVVLLSLILGYISAYFYKNSNSSSKPRLLCFCTLAGVWVLWSPLSWAGGFHSAGTIIFWLLILDAFAIRLRIRW